MHRALTVYNKRYSEANDALSHLDNFLFYLDSLSQLLSHLRFKYCPTKMT